MARYARVVSMETWNRQNGEDEAGFEGRRRRRRKQRRQKGRSQGASRPSRQPRPMPRRASGGAYPEEEATALHPRAQAMRQPQTPEYVYDDEPEEDEEDPEAEGDFGAPIRRADRQGRPAGGRGLFGPGKGKGADPRGLLHKGGGQRLREGLAPPWSPAISLGPNLKMKARKGFRAAVVEVKPGLFVVAEVPERSVEFGLGPLLLAPALVKTLGRAFRRRQAGQDSPGVQQQSASPPALPPPPARPALPGPTADDERLARWLDDDIAAELGCRACDRRG
jgi:hypothetical protein